MLEIRPDGGLDDGSLLNLSPSDESPVTLDATRQGNLLSNLTTDRLIECDLGQVSLDGRHPTSRRQGSDVDHQDLASRQLLHLQTNDQDQGSRPQPRRQTRDRQEARRQAKKRKKKGKALN